MPRSPPLFPPVLRLSTIIGVAALEFGARNPWQLLTFTTGASMSSASTSFKTCLSRAKNFISSRGSALWPISYSAHNAQTPLSYVGWRSTAAFPSARQEVAVLSRGICLTPRAQSHCNGEALKSRERAAKFSPRFFPPRYNCSNFSSGFLLSSARDTRNSLVAVTRSPFTVGAGTAFAYGKTLFVGSSMAFKLPPLPYDVNALAPHISAETLQFHHGKHHAAYVNKLNELVKGTKFESLSIEDVIRQASGPILNNGGQAWNHTFYWNCMKPKKEGGGSEPQGPLREAMLKKWSSYDKFKEEFSKVAAGHFGSGWAWLSYSLQKKELEIQQTHDGGSLIQHTTHVPLLCCDVWEHAYYIDRRNDRGAYIKAWWEVVNWKFAEKNYEDALRG